MKLNREKYELARARSCKGVKDLVAAGIPKGTLCGSLEEEMQGQKQSVRLRGFSVSM